MDLRSINELKCIYSLWRYIIILKFSLYWYNFSGSENLMIEFILLMNENVLIILNKKIFAAWDWVKNE
jgi:hypothetical protein